MPTTRCPGCDVQVADIDGPFHAYMVSSPGCWQLFGEVLAAEASDVTRWRAHQLAVDAYVVQHPTSPDAGNRKSVAVHLVSLHFLLAQELPPRAGSQASGATLVKRGGALGVESSEPEPGPAPV